ncbi:MAPEG family protein [Sphingobium nicotianae]|uniref:MAPEG family protein n=1 Tax=Sphingobium nicotianae TaxID=2782607 RepID=A0A9X1IRP3_9SPHN|nr:MAPEG family protein [Sphingobium nicotianae]MBT2187681.1 MAPEG family protein [Sphingobium nicotianae]
MSGNLIAPALALVLWSLIMLAWMFFVRLPALMKLNVSSDKARGGRGQDLDRMLPREINWVGHNYAHLMEQPTLFYATVFALVLLGQTTPVTVGLAWAYVALRVVHSVWQAKVNTIPIRAGLFFAGSFVLLAMVIIGFIAALRV